MINFNYRTDEIFNQILIESFDRAIDFLRGCDEKDFRCFFPNVSLILSKEKAIETLESLSFSHQSPGVYSFNNYHRVLMLEALYNYCECSNEEAEGKFPIIEGTKIVVIIFDNVVDHYFPETDCCFDCLMKELKPFPRELECELLTEGNYSFLDDKNDESFFTSDSNIYPNPQYFEDCRKEE